MSSSPPLITVIIPTYNYSAVLRYAITSVLNQTLADFELIVVGDGCTDDSAEVVASFNDPRIRWFNLPENTGSQAIPNNTAIAMARGEYIAYLGHDDLWLPDHLEVLSGQLRADGAAWGNSLMLRVGPPQFPHHYIVGYGQMNLEEVKPPQLMHRRHYPTPLRWKSPAEMPAYRFSEVEFMRQLVESAEKSTLVEQITAIKFTAVHRKDGYKLGLADEQAEYMRRMQQDPVAFLNDEIAATLKAYATDSNDIPMVLGLTDKDQTPGYMIEMVRRVKGLAPREGYIQAGELGLQSGILTRQMHIRQLEDALTQVGDYLNTIAPRVEQLPHLEEQIRALEQANAALCEQITAVQAEVAAMRSTRAWRMAEKFWRLRNRLLRRNA